MSLIFSKFLPRGPFWCGVKAQIEIVRRMNVFTFLVEDVIPSMIDWRWLRKCDEFDCSLIVIWTLWMNDGDAWSSCCELDSGFNVTFRLRVLFPCYNRIGLMPWINVQNVCVFNFQKKHKNPATRHKRISLTIILIEWSIWCVL